MNVNDIFKVLREREGYNEQQARLLAKDLSNVNIEIFPLLEAWIKNGSTQGYCEKGISISNLMEINKMSYPAAISTIDWLIKEPEIALPVISKMTNTKR